MMIKIKNQENKIKKTLSWKYINKIQINKIYIYMRLLMNNLVLYKSKLNLWIGFKENHLIFCTY
jgi:hypothetical protein